METDTELVSKIISKHYDDMKKIDNIIEKISNKTVGIDVIKTAYNRIGSIYHHNIKDYEKAEEYYLKAIEVGDIKSYVNIGHLYQQHEYYKKAEEIYLKGCKFGDKYIFYNLGSLYDNIFKDYEKAIEYYLTAIESGHIYTHIYLGNIYYYNLEDYKKAEEYYLKAIESGDFASYRYLGYLFMETGNTEEAEDCFISYLELYDELSESDIEDARQVIKELSIKNKKFTKVYTDIYKDECIICRDLLMGTSDGVITFVCGHSYHIKCATKCHLRCDEA